MNILCKTAIAGVSLLAAMSFAGAANAAIATANTANCGGFNTCDDSAFLAAIGGAADVFIDFATDKNGVPTVDGAISGDAFSDLVTFSSRYSATYGGSDSANVQMGNGGTTFAEIGPAGTYDGILDIIFATGASAVGFGTVEFGAAESISIYDTSNVLLANFGGVSNFTFDYFGVYATAGELIGRISLEGSFFAIQNIQFNADVVPLPGALLLFPAGLAALGFSRRRRKTA